MGTKRPTPPTNLLPAPSAGPAAPRAPAREGDTSLRVFSLRWIVTLAAVTLTAAGVLSIGVVSERAARQTLTTEIEARLQLEARNLALASSGALLGDYPELTLSPVVREMTKRQPELAFSVVTDHSGRIQGHADPRRLGTPYAPPGGLRPVPRAVLHPGETLGETAALLVAGSPVTLPDGRTIGTAWVGLTRGYVDQRLAAARRRQLVVMAIFMIAGVGATLLLMSQLLRPIGVLRAGIERIGRGDLDTPIRIRDRTEFGLLAGTVNDMAGALKRAQIEMLERERLAHEVELARQIQRSLLPAEPVIAGEFVIRGDHRAASEVGGDYFDVLRLPDGRIAVAVADVAGKGLAGCLIMSMLSSLLRAFRTTHGSPSAMLAALDERLGESLPPGTFVTMFYGLLDPRTGCVVCASAGHNPALVYRAATGRVERVCSRGIPLGAIRGGAILATLRDETVVLGPGDRLVQFTDGYSEATDPAGGEQFGIERIEETLARTAASGAAQVIESLRGAVRRWGGGSARADDETLLVVSREASAAAPAPDPGPPGERELRRALDCLAEAEQRGYHLRLPARLDSLVAIRRWLDGVPLLADLHGEDAELLSTALYEVCANIAEHGYAEDPGRSIGLWWIPPVNGETPIGGTAADDPADPAARVRRGTFVIHDNGAPFSADNWKATDFSNPSVRRRGRGFGLDIIHRVMGEVAYHAGTPRGNITLLVFGPRPTADQEEGAAA